MAGPEPANRLKRDVVWWFARNPNDSDNNRGHLIGTRSPGIGREPNIGKRMGEIPRSPSHGCAGS